MQNPRHGALLAMAGTLVALAACGEAPTAPATQVAMFSAPRANIIFLLTSVTPATATVAAGGTQQFSAIDGGGGVMAAPDVTWSVSGGGSISTSGLFTAGAAAGTFTVVATGTANGATVSATVTVTAGSGTGTGTGTGTCRPEPGKKECEKERAGKDEKDDKGKGKGDDHKDDKKNDHKDDHKNGH
jgi:hypothetical protein